MCARARKIHAALFNPFMSKGPDHKPVTLEDLSASVEKKPLQDTEGEESLLWLLYTQAHARAHTHTPPTSLACSLTLSICMLAK